MFLNFWNKFIFSNFHIDTAYKENHQPIFAIAFSHLTHSANVFPEQQFHVGLVVGGRQGKETVEHILGKSDQLLRRTERRLELMGLIIVICLFVPCKSNWVHEKRPNSTKPLQEFYPLTMLDIRAIYNIGSGLRSTWLFSTCVMSQPCKQRQRCHSGFCWKDGRLTAGTARRPFWGQMPHGEAFERCSGLCEVCFWRRIWVRAGMDVQCWCWRTCAGWEKKKENDR